MSPLTILLILLCSPCLSQNFTFPDRLTIPRGGCRQVPLYYSHMADNTSLTFPTNHSLEITPNSLLFKQYTTSEQRQTFVFCTTNSADPNNFTIQYNIDYPWNYTHKGTLLVSIANSTTTELKPVEWENQQIKDNCMEFGIKTPGSGDGNVYYSIKNSRNRLEDCKEFQIFCRDENISDFGYDRNGSQMKIALFNLLEGRKYNVCALYRENNLESSAISCREFTTDISGKMLRSRFKFTQQIDYPMKVNALLCFMSEYLEVHPRRGVMTNDGFSCSGRNSQPRVFPYQYTVGITTRSGNETILYIDQGCFAEDQEERVRSKYNQIWDKNGQISPSFDELLKNSNITWIQTGTNLGYKATKQMLHPTKPLNMKYTSYIKTTKHPNKTTSTTFQVNNITTNNQGTVYFMLLINSSKGFKPTPQHIINCQLPKSESGMKLCQRVTFSGQTKKAPSVGYKIRNIEEKMKARVFYVEVSEYPKIPIPTSQVKEIKFQIKNFWIPRKSLN